MVNLLASLPPHTTAVSPPSSFTAPPPVSFKERVFIG